MFRILMLGVTSEHAACKIFVFPKPVALKTVLAQRP